MSDDDEMKPMYIYVYMCRSVVSFRIANNRPFELLFCAQDYGQKLREHAVERGVDAEAIREALKYVRLHSGIVQSIGAEPSPKTQASNEGSQSSSSSSSSSRGGDNQR